MQKSPILPAPPFQAGYAIFSTPTAETPAAQATVTVVPYRMLMGVGLTLSVFFPFVLMLSL